jgi:ABC-type phosphate transport system auxiliary subunit
MVFRAELESLSQEAEAYRKSSKMLLAEQHFVVKRFFAVLVARVRDIFQRFASEFEEWLNSVLEPLRLQILERKEQMEQRLTSLKRISRSKSSLDGRLQRLEAERRALSDRLDSLRAISAVLRARPPEAAISAPAPDRPTARRAVHP